jgi:hypothetical protein
MIGFHVSLPMDEKSESPCDGLIGQLNFVSSCYYLSTCKYLKISEPPHRLDAATRGAISLTRLGSHFSPLVCRERRCCARFGRLVQCFSQKNTVTSCLHIMKMTAINGRPNEEAFTRLARIQQKACATSHISASPLNEVAHGTEAGSFTASIFLMEKEFAQVPTTGTPFYG